MAILTPGRDQLASFVEVEGRSLWQDAWRRLLRNKAAVVSIVVLLLITLMAILAPWLSPHPFDEVYWDRIGMPPDFANAHWFGTDGNGRDLFVRTLYGARVSLAVGVAATLVSLAIGVVYGAAAGFIGGKVDEVMMRLVDIL
jgi:oligopeptide transport system permease protein